MRQVGRLPNKSRVQLRIGPTGRVWLTGLVCSPAAISHLLSHRSSPDEQVSVLNNKDWDESPPLSCLVIHIEMLRTLLIRIRMEFGFTAIEHVPHGPDRL